MQRNIQTFFPSLPSPATRGPWPPPPAPAPLPPESSTVVRSDSANVAKAVAATAVSSFAFCGLLLFLFQFFVARRRRKQTAPVPPAKISPLQRLRSKASLRRSAFVDDNGLDAVYWREINGKGCAHCGRRRFRAGGHVEDGEEEHGGFGEEGASPARSGWRNQEKPLLRAGYVSSSSPSFNVQSPFSPRPAQINQHLPPPPNQRLPLPPGRVTQSATALPPRPPIATSPPPPEPKPNAAPPSPVPPPPVRNSNAAAAPPPPPSPEAQQSAKPPAPPPPPPAAQSSAKPPVPPPPKPPVPPPPPPAAQPSAKPPVPPPPPPAAKPSAKSPPPPPPRPNNKPPAPGAPPPPPPGRSGGGAPSARPPAGPVPPAAVPTGGKKLKPLHWDKVNAFNIEHSMVWDKINKGSFRVDEDSMEYLFGTIAPKKAASNSSNASTSAGNATAPAQISLLDPRKSQNIAIVLRSIAVNRREIIDGLLEGRGLSNDVLARLTTIAVTKEEEDLVRGYSGDPARLAEAESFLFHILGAVPAPFARLNALLFRDNYGPEAAHLKQSLRTLEEACRELKTPTRGLFLKLLETVLKAGNRMNAGTARGDAQAFNLTALRKLADVKSTDGSTTLLHFVVEEVVRAEGKRLVVNRANSLRRSDSGASSAGAALERTPSRAAAREEREFEYTKLGLPIVGGLSDEFVNLKKAAAIDYDALITACPALQARVSEIMRLLEASGGGGRFAREMGAFVERANEELKGIRAEQTRVLELVKKTAEYYHPGASKVKDAHPLHLFMVVKDFMDMVDKACIDITRNLQKKKQAAAAARAGSGSGSSGKSQRVPEASERGRRPVAMFPNLPPGFMSANSRSDSSSDDDD